MKENQQVVNTDINAIISLQDAVILWVYVYYNMPQKDVFLNTKTYDFFVFNGNNWQKSGNLKGPTGETGVQGIKGDQGIEGPQGPEGKRGSLWITAEGAPASSTNYKEWDLYFNSLNSDVYVNNGSTWQLIANIKGATGDTGLQGPKGADGVTPTIVAGDTKTLSPGEAAQVKSTTTGATTVFDFSVPQGPKGDAGSRWYSGNEAPSEKTGLQDERGAPRPGDMYLHLDQTKHEAETYILTEEKNWAGPLATVAGPQGAPGVDGVTYSFNVGTVTSLDAGSEPTIEYDVNDVTHVITVNYGIPKGLKGDTGSQGIQGETGATGPQGESYVNDGTVDLNVKSISSETLLSKLLTLPPTGMNDIPKQATSPFYKKGTIAYVDDYFNYQNGEKDLVNSLVIFEKDTDNLSDITLLTKFYNTSNMDVYNNILSSGANIPKEIQMIYSDKVCLRGIDGLPHAIVLDGEIANYLLSREFQLISEDGSTSLTIKEDTTPDYDGGSPVPKIGIFSKSGFGITLPSDENDAYGVGLKLYSKNKTSNLMIDDFTIASQINTDDNSIRSAIIQQGLATSISHTTNGMTSGISFAKGEVSIVGKAIGLVCMDKSDNSGYLKEGEQAWDSTNKKPCWYDGTKWVDAMGNAV